MFEALESEVAVMARLTEGPVTLRRCQRRRAAEAQLAFDFDGEPGEDEVTDQVIHQPRANAVSSDEPIVPLDSGAIEFLSDIAPEIDTIDTAASSDIKGYRYPFTGPMHRAYPNEIRGKDRPFNYWRGRFADDPASVRPP